MLRGPTRLSGRTSAKPRPAPAHQLPLGSLIEVGQGLSRAAHYRPLAWWLGGGRGSWGWEVGQLPASVLAAEPWPPDALPLSLHSLSKTSPLLRAPGAGPPPPAPPSVPPPPGEPAGLLLSQQWPPLFLHHPAPAGIALHCRAFLSRREKWEECVYLYPEPSHVRSGPSRWKARPGLLFPHPLNSGRTIWTM